MDSSNLHAFEVAVLVTHKGASKKFLKRYIVISDSIPKNSEDLNLPENEEFLESKKLNHVVIK